MALYFGVGWVIHRLVSSARSLLLFILACKWFEHYPHTSEKRCHRLLIKSVCTLCTFPRLSPILLSPLLLHLSVYIKVGQLQKSEGFLLSFLHQLFFTLSTDILWYLSCCLCILIGLVLIKIVYMVFQFISTPDKFGNWISLTLLSSAFLVSPFFRVLCLFVEPLGRFWRVNFIFQGVRG